MRVESLQVSEYLFEFPAGSAERLQGSLTSSQLGFEKRVVEKVEKA